MKRLRQPLTLRSDISMQNKLNLKSIWPLRYEEKPSLLIELFFIVSSSDAFTEKQSASCPRQQALVFEKDSDTFWWTSTSIRSTWVRQNRRQCFIPWKQPRKKLPSEGSDSWVGEVSPKEWLCPHGFTYTFSLEEVQKNSSGSQGHEAFWSNSRTEAKHKWVWTRKHP